MAEPTTDDAQKVKTRNIILSVLISVSISAYLFATTFDAASLAAVHISKRLILGFFLAAVALIIRDFAFMYKVRLSSGEKLSWGQSLQTIIMWEFGAAITPKLGEVAFTLFVLKRSGLSYGRSTGIIVINSFLDNLVFVVAFGILYLVLGHHILFVSTDCSEMAGSELMQKALLQVRHLADKAWIGYAIFCVVALFFGITIFALPERTKLFFHRIGDIPLLHRLQGTLYHLGDEIEITANEYKNQHWGFWAKMTGATFINWTCRYLMVNALVFAFASATPDMWEVYARQYVLWIFLVIPTTPGASGWAEVSFIALNCEFMRAGLAVTIATIWRIYTFYLYLLVGVIVLPGWLKRTAGNTASINGNTGA
jgi:uncharacterized membrane protein YbhN (UPF0104 family)